MKIPNINIRFEMSDKDNRFFDEHWRAWVKRNPPPTGWMLSWTAKEWAELEMPCRGILGRALYWLSMQVNIKKFDKDGDDNIGL